MGKKLFNKVCTLTIGNREYKYPPFDIEFDQKIGESPVTEVRLYNPNEDTVTAVSKINAAGEGPKVAIDAGYSEIHGVCVNGYVTTFNIKKERMDKVLIFQVKDAANKLIRVINKTYNNQSAANVLKDLVSIAGVTCDTIQLGIDTVNYKSFTASTFDWALEIILKDTKSKAYYNNGFMSVLPASFKTKPKEGYILSKDSGLINVPERAIVGGIAGIRLQTLFLFNLNLGNIFKLDSKYTNINGTYQIAVGKKKFSSFQRSFCDFEAVPV
jgi:hypothetical protein